MSQPKLIDDEADIALIQCYNRKFIDGSHILHHNGVVDAYGHLSFRHPLNPDVFVMSRCIAPGTISSPLDLIEYWVSNAEPLDPNSAKGYAERCIHSEIYKRHRDVNAAAHSHSEAVIPYTISGVPLKACYHAAGFIGSKGAPVYDIANHFEEGDGKDMLVRYEHLGSALAALFDGGNSVVLMRGHGFTVVAENMECAVLRAVYTQKNATILTAAITLRAAANANERIPPEEAPKIRYLNEEEASAAAGMTRWSVQRPWLLWMREVEASKLYLNSA
ncbi:class II aldolase and Adducin N-terminal domain-containing protein [Bombardia bombarda]|uniref:Class II aldolase and Adducin N-terminal domain-containing protein n=1 Tax=Bombardia bombarda TaxID=252184 RepID=A0AA40C2A7_9PEZI|nr:class II aldolase and Adducin N-terminal domain-containing protein [Bombardia bombarda]